jgi:tellurite resistance protein TerC
MDQTLFFPFAEYWWFYAVFSAFILVMLALDLGVFHRDAHEVSFKEAATWSAVWLTLAIAFAGVLYWYAGSTFPADARLMEIPGFDPRAAARQVTLEYLTGLIVEKSLAVDNIFVFVIVFTYFAVPPIYQHRVLFYGILGALVFRVIFIALGSVLLKYSAVVILFGLFLIATGVKIIFAPEKPMDPERNPVIRLLRKALPITPSFEGQRFLIRKDGRWWGTPLLVALVVIEVSDIIFAVDSVPAIFALTKEPLIVFTSNVFAILGLRAMYFLLAGVVGRFRLLKYGLGLVLVFVGLKMAWLNEAFGGKFPITWSLGIITVLVGSSIAASLLVPVRKAGPAA